MRKFIVLLLFLASANAAFVRDDAKLVVVDQNRALMWQDNNGSF